MKKEYWLTRWSENNIGFNQKEPHAYLKKFFPALQLSKSSHVFAPLCGKSIDVLWLSEQGMKVTGIELSSKACADFFNEASLDFTITNDGDFEIYQGENITLIAGDFFNLHKSMMPEIDAIYDRAALIALPQEMRLKYAEHVLSFHSKHTQMLLITIDYDQLQMAGPPFSVSEEEIKNLYGHVLSIERCYEKCIDPIPPHLKDKGLAQAVEKAFYLNVKE